MVGAFSCLRRENLVPQQLPCRSNCRCRQMDTVRYVALPDRCGLWGCTLSRTHTGMCNVAFGGSRRERKATALYDDAAESARVQRMRERASEGEGSWRRSRLGGPGGCSYILRAPAVCLAGASVCRWEGISR